MPISLLPSFSEILKKLIYSRLYTHICTNNILVKKQYGFRINSSTEAASYYVINKILKATNNRLSVGGTFCDLKKAFECVNHGILVDKLQFYAIKGKLLALIQSYLRGRYHKVLIDKFNAYDDVSCGWKKITNGVPQVSILGPSSSSPFTPCGAQGIHEELPSFAISSYPLDLVPRSSCVSYFILYCPSPHSLQPTSFLHH